MVSQKFGPKLYAKNVIVQYAKLILQWVGLTVEWCG